jgi:hypothetical protein
MDATPLTISSFQEASTTIPALHMYAIAGMCEMVLVFSVKVPSETSYVPGTIDEIQKLHIRTVPLGEQPRRLAHQEATRTLAVGVVTTDYTVAEQPETAAVRPGDRGTSSLVLRATIICA